MFTIKREVETEYHFTQQYIKQNIYNSKLQTDNIIIMCLDTLYYFRFCISFLKTQINNTFYFC